MRIRVLTEAGQVELDDLDVGCTTAQLLQAATAKSPWCVPPPQIGKAVFQGRPLEVNSSLSDAGVSDGDTVVVIRSRKQGAGPSEEPVDSDPGPDEQTILRITTEELKKSGKLKDLGDVSAPPPSSSNHSEDLTPRLRHMENHLQQLLDAVEGLNLSIRDNRAGRESGDDVEDSSTEDPPPPLPEPNPHYIEQLCDMGFPEEVVKKALLLTNNRLEQATEWLLEHAGDLDAATPLTEEQLRELVGQQRRPQRSGGNRYRPPGQASSSGAASAAQGAQTQSPQPHLVEQLVEMGFESGQATAALQAFGNNIEIACHWLLSSGNRPGTVPPTLHTQVAPERAGDDRVEMGGGIVEGVQPPSTLGEQLDVDTPYGNPGAGSDNLLSSFSSAAPPEDDVTGPLSSPAVQRFLHGLDVDTVALAELLQNPVIREALQNDRVLQALQDMLLNPSRTPEYLSDPEVGPALLQVHRQFNSGSVPPPDDPSNVGDSQ